MDALHHARAARRQAPTSWDLQLALMEFLEGGWHEPDEGIWEVRGPRRHFTHSKVMAWVAVDRAVRSVEEFGRDGPATDGGRCATRSRRGLANGVDDRGVFVQTCDTKALDASLLLVPLVGFLPPDDERVVGTVDAIQRELTATASSAVTAPNEDLDGLPRARAPSSCARSGWPTPWP